METAAPAATGRAGISFSMGGGRRHRDNNRILSLL